LAEQNQNARLDVEGNAPAVLVHIAVAGGDHPAWLRFLFRRVRNDDSADLLFASFEALNDDSVVKRSDIHAVNSQLTGMVHCLRLEGGLVRESRFLLGSARVLGFFVLAVDLALWRLAL